MKLSKRYTTKFGLQPHVKLRGYQLKAVNRGIQSDHIALLMDPRLGKTRIDIAIAGYRFLQGQINSWLIICPSIAKYVWSREISETLNVPHHIEIVEGNKESRKKTVQQKFQPGTLSIWIINVEATWRLKEWLYKKRFGKITVDESHWIKNHTAKQSKSVHALGNRGMYRSILTGTFLSDPGDAFSQLKFLDPQILGSNVSEFRNRYVKSYGFGGYKPAKWKNLDNLNDLINQNAFILKRSDVRGFPSEQYQNIEFDLTAPTTKHYQEMEDDMYTVLESEDVVSADIILSQVLRLQQITSGFLPVEDKLVKIGSDRIEALKELLREYPSTESIVIFARFVFELELIRQTIKRPASMITGQITGSDRQKAIDDFQSRKTTLCLIQVKAGGVSINLDKADTAIFYSMTFSYFDYEQAKARIISPNKSSVSIIHLQAKNTIDELVFQTVTGKQDLTKLVMRKR